MEKSVSKGSSCRSLLRSCVKGTLSGDLAYRHGSCSDCEAGKFPVQYTHSDRDRDAYLSPDSGKLCLSSTDRDRFVRSGTIVHEGVFYHASPSGAQTTRLSEPAECGSDPTGVVSVNYGAVDADGDGYFIEQSGSACLMSRSLPQTKQTSVFPRPTYAASVPQGKGEPNLLTDRNALEPIGPFLLVGPSEAGSGASNGYERLFYEKFEPGVGFYYRNTLVMQSSWNLDFSKHGLRVASVAGGSGEFSYSVRAVAAGASSRSAAPAATARAHVDFRGRVVLACGVAPGTEFELQVRDLRTGLEQAHRFYSTGDGAGCAFSGPGSGVCLDPTALNYWQEATCAYPESTPMVEEPEPTPTPTPSPTQADDSGPTEECPETEVKVSDLRGCSSGRDGAETCQEETVAHLVASRKTGSVNSGTLDILGETFDVAELPFGEKQYDGCRKCVRPGTYVVSIVRSPTFDYSYLPRLEDRHGRTGILIHTGGEKLWQSEGVPNPGKVREWSKGCILLQEQDMQRLIWLLAENDVAYFLLNIIEK
jgi:hypothetical protein